MTRQLLVVLTLAITLAAVVAAAATLSVNGGTIQVFRFPVELEPPEPEPPPPGQAGTSIEAEKTAQGFDEYDDGGQRGVLGEICVTNGGERATENLLIVDTVQSKPKGPGPYQDTAHSMPVSTAGKPVLQPGETHCYSYEINFDPEPDTLYRNSVRVTITNHSGHLGQPFGPSPKADFDFEG